MLSLTLNNDVEKLIKETIINHLKIEPQEIKKYMTKQEAANLMGISLGSFETHYIAAGLPVINIGKRKMVDYEDLVKFNEILKV